MKFLASFILLLSSLTWAQVNSLSSSKVNLLKPEKKWNLGLDYKVSSNLLNEDSKRPYNHILEAEYSVELGKIASGEWGASVGTGFEGISDGNNFKNEKDSKLHINDTDLSLFYSQKTFLESTLKVGISESLPTGYESQLESYLSIVGMSAALSTPFLNNKLKISNVVSINGIINTYSESPITKESNPNVITSYNIKFGYQLYKNLVFGIGAGARNVRFLNGENSIRTSSSESISYNLSSMSISFSYLNGNYDDNDSLRFLFQDETRQVVKIGVSIEI